MSKLPGWLIELVMLLRTGIVGTTVIMLLAAGWVWYRNGAVSVSEMVTPMFLLAVLPMLAAGAAATGHQDAEVQNRVWYRDLEQLSADQKRHDARHRSGFLAYCLAIGLTAMAVAMVLGLAAG